MATPVLSYSNPLIEAQAPQTKYVLVYPSGRVECYINLEDAQADQQATGGTLMHFVKKESLCAVGVSRRSRATHRK